MADPGSTLGRWVFALKPASWPKLLVPTLLGQALGIAGTGTFAIAPLLLGLGFSLALTVHVVLLNDHCDREVDALKRRMFPEAGGKKTIFDGILDPRSVLESALGACALALAFAWLAERVLSRPGTVTLALACLLLPWAYSWRPLGLNYRGGGELLEMIGVGVLLPWFQAHLHGGAAVVGGLPLGVPLCLLALASAVASGLADEDSDRLGGKHTYVTAVGNRRARQAIETLVAAAAWMLPLSAVVAGLGPGPLASLPATVALLVGHDRLRRCSASADARMYAGQREYKRVLHRSGQLAVIVLAVAIVATGPGGRG